MYIYKIIIDNFRNIKHLEWKPDKKINILFGHNGCGKSNVAQALNLLFLTSKKSEYFDINDFYQKNDNNGIVIEAWIDEIDDVEIVDKDLAVRYISEDDKVVNEDAELEKCKEMLIVQLKNEDDRRMEWSLLTNGDEIKFNYNSRKSINYNFVGTQRNPIKELSFGYQTLLQDFIDDEIEYELKTISSDAVTLINDKLSESQKINFFLENNLHIDDEIDGANQYKIISKDLSENKAYINYELGISKTDYDLPIESQSTGIQNLLLLSLMKKKLEGRGIVFIEELEQNLEPKNQVYILDQYKKLKVGQLFITSHSPEIIESFDYNNIFFMNNNKIDKLFDMLTTECIKEICKANKKSFISAVMSKRVILVEGRSEFNSIPIYITEYGKFLDYSLIQIDGKGNFTKYIDSLNKLGIKPYVLIDNDDDLRINQIKKWSHQCEKIFISQNDYEDWIYPFINDNLEKLEEYISFNKIKGAFCSSNDDEIKAEIDSKGKENLNTYTDLKDMKSVIRYMLHSSFASTYYSRLLANLLVEENFVPEQLKLIVDNLLEARKLKLFNKENENIYLLEGDNGDSE